tara:strand:- start:71 stop:274 length:204 start_codon:yes stop_codon:yes gene_type:complete
MDQNDEDWVTSHKDVLRKLVDEKILELISEQKSLLIKAGPGKDKDVHNRVRELHKQISLYLNSLEKL